MSMISTDRPESEKQHVGLTLEFTVSQATPSSRVGTGIWGCRSITRASTLPRLLWETDTRVGYKQTVSTHVCPGFRNYGLSIPDQPFVLPSRGRIWNISFSHRLRSPPVWREGIINNHNWDTKVQCFPHSTYSRCMCGGSPQYHLSPYIDFLVFFGKWNPFRRLKSHFIV